VRDVLPVGIALYAVLQTTVCQYLQGGIAGTAPSLWVGVVPQNGVLKLLLEPIEMGVGRLFWHQSMTLWH